MLLGRKRVRRGATLIEGALVYPIVFLLMLGVILLGVAVFRYQQCSHIAREASRWASCHGARYARETGNPAATPAAVYASAILPQAAGMHGANLGYSVSWSTSNEQTHTGTYVDPATSETKVISVFNTVSVTVTYTWNTGLFGTIPVSSTSTVTMQY